MSRIDDVFAGLADRDELALMPYLMAGFPDLDTSLQLLQTAAENGADLIELGIPFSDPIADGPTIQYASQVALDNGTALETVLQRLQSIKLSVPLVAMSYLNPLLAYGRDQLLADLPAAGIDGLIIPDLPVEEADEWVAATASAGIDLVFLAAPTSDDDRLERIGAASRGFVYAVSVTGITGARSELSDQLPAYLKRLSNLSKKPVGVGFGISTPEHIQRLRGHAAGAIVGSRLIDAIRRNEDPAPLLQTLKNATRSQPCSS